jgi:hypothetical protein
LVPLNLEWVPESISVDEQMALYPRHRAEINEKFIKVASIAFPYMIKLVSFV